MSNSNSSSLSAVVTPKLLVENGKILTSSLEVAKIFNKQHQHVLRSIDRLDIPQDYRQSNFGQGYYTMSATGEQRHRQVLMTRDGFTLLVMGFNGKNAMKFKIAYIEAFNEMEEKLRQQSIDFKHEFSRKRFVVSFRNDNKAFLNEIPADAMVISKAELPRWIADPGNYLSKDEGHKFLKEIALAAMARLTLHPSEAWGMLYGKDAGVLSK